PTQACPGGPPRTDMRAAGITICRDSRRSPPATTPGTIHGTNDPTPAWARLRKETTDVEDRRDPQSGVRVDRGPGCRAIRGLLRALSRRDARHVRLRPGLGGLRRLADV